MNKQTFIEELKKIGINPTAEQLNNLEIYYKLLVEENDKYNLTSIIKKEEVYLKHFYDSLTIVKGIKLDNQYLCDIGTGAGFPGLVIKIFFPNMKIDLVDATEKKCNFINMVITRLQLKNIKTINIRAEEYAKTIREKYDIVTSRAVAPIKHLLEYSIPLLKVNGYFVILKGNLKEEELLNINNYYKKLNITELKEIKFTLPIEESNRTIVISKKLKETNKKYPRSYSQIKNKDI